jgi:hypothetical protein
VDAKIGWHRSSGRRADDRARRGILCAGAAFGSRRRRLLWLCRAAGDTCVPERAACLGTLAPFQRKGTDGNLEARARQRLWPLTALDHAVCPCERSTTEGR